MRVLFLGTAGAKPTVVRNVSATLVQTSDTSLLVDCGEGTYRQLLRYGANPSVAGVLLTHAHDDHTLGLPGLIDALSATGPRHPLALWGPRGTAHTVRHLLALLGDAPQICVDVHEIMADQQFVVGGLRVATFGTRHRGPSLGYVICVPRQSDAIGEKAIPSHGASSHSPSTDLRVVITGDTAPCSATISAAAGAALLVHDATFTEELAERATSTGHSTAAGAARVARAAGVRMLPLTHVSARHAAEERVLAKEGRSEFARALVARDGLEIAFRACYDAELIPVSSASVALDVPGIELINRRTRRQGS